MVLLSVVVPTYNEAGHIREFLADVERNLEGRDYEVIVVDDNSPDGTHHLVEAYARDHPGIVPVVRLRERGLATAVLEGMKRARGDFVVVMDSDYQHPPATVPRLLDAAQVQDADCVVASRYATGGSVTGFPATRRVISWGARTLAVVGLPIVRRFRIRDPMSGFFLVRKDRVRISELRPRGYKILLEILARCDLRRVAEVGFAFQDRRAGASKLRAKTQVDYFFHVASLALQDRTNRRVASFIAVGASGTIVALALLSYLTEVWTMDEWWIQEWRGQRFLLGALAAGVIVRELSILWNFIWNDRITFHRERVDAHAGFLHRLLRFHIVSLGAFLVYLAIYYPLVHFGVHVLPAAFAGILAGFLLNYTGNMRWTYARRRETHGH